MGYDFVVPRSSGFSSTLQVATSSTSASTGREGRAAGDTGQTCGEVCAAENVVSRQTMNPAAAMWLFFFFFFSFLSFLFLSCLASSLVLPLPPPLISRSLGCFEGSEKQRIPARPSMTSRFYLVFFLA